MRIVASKYKHKKFELVFYYKSLPQSRLSRYCHFPESNHTFVFLQFKIYCIDHKRDVTL